MKHFLESNSLLLGMAALTALVILIKCACCLTYRALLRDAKRLPNAKNKRLCAMYARFEAGYKLRVPMPGTDYFVRQQLEQGKLSRLPLQRMASLDCLCAVLLTAIVPARILYGIYAALSVRFLLLQAAALAFLLSLLLGSELLFGVRRQKYLLYLQLVHYFENTLRPRFEKEYLHPQETESYRNSYFEEEVEELKDAFLEEEKIDGQLAKQKERLQAAATTEKLRLVEEMIRAYVD